MGRNLFEGGSDEGDEDEAQLLTNKEYAKSYNNIKRKELLKKFKDHQEDSSSSDSQSESDYSEDELIHNPEFDNEFLKALCSLKSKDPKIYDKKTQFFMDVEIHKPTNEAKKEKKFTLKDYERKVVVEKGGIFEDDDSDHRTSQRPQSPSYVEEQEKLKAEFRKVVHSDADSEEEFGGMFRQKEGSNKEKDEEEPLNWLAGKQVEIGEDVRRSLNPLKAYWTQQNLPKQEKFLRDYIINKGYADGEEVDAVSILDNTVDCGNLSEDEEELEKQAEFEHKYNFRFEEPDKEFIKRYPRTIENTVRKKDDKRKKKREETKERKENEKKEKFKEIEMLKALKKKEIEEKIRQLKEVTGNDDLPFQDKDIEEEFDPVAHDRRMREIFNDQYYDIEEDEEKPECPDIEELKTEDWDNYDPHNDEDVAHYYEPHCEDDDFVMDNDYDPHNKQNFQDELIENSRSTKNRRKRRNRFMEMIKAEKPPFNPEDEKSYGDYIEEYYKMDCEDIIDELPCRFKYVETVPNDFGLSIEEILLAKTKELNQWASLKKTVQIRPEYEEKKDRRLYKLKATNEALKRKIFASLYAPESEDGNDENDKCELKASPVNDITQKKKKKKRAKAAGGNSTLSNNSHHRKSHEQLTAEVETGESRNQKSNSGNTLQKTSEKEKSAGKQPILDQIEILSSEKKKDETKNKFTNEDRRSSSKKVKNQKFKTKKNCESSVTNISKDRLKAYGINPRKFARKLRNDLQNKT